MNRWLGGIVIILFLILFLVSIIFGGQVKNLNNLISATPVPSPTKILLAPHKI